MQQDGLRKLLGQEAAVAEIYTIISIGAVQFIGDLNRLPVREEHRQAIQHSAKK